MWKLQFSPLTTTVKFMANKLLTSSSLLYKKVTWIKRIFTSNHACLTWNFIHAFSRYRRKSHRKEESRRLRLTERVLWANNFSTLSIIFNNWIKTSHNNGRFNLYKVQQLHNYEFKKLNKIMKPVCEDWLDMRGHFLNHHTAIDGFIDVRWRNSPLQVFATLKWWEAMTTIKERL